jgi:hypothetical protein
MGGTDGISATALGAPRSWPRLARGAILAILAFGAPLPSEAFMAGPGFTGSATRMSHHLWQVRRHLRRHRHWARQPEVMEQKAKEKALASPGQLGNAKPHKYPKETGVSPPAPPAPPSIAKAKPLVPAHPPIANAAPPEPAKPQAPEFKPQEPAQPQKPAPPQWTAAEAQAAGWECGELMTGTGAVFERMPPFKEGSEGECGAPAPIRLRGFKFEDGPDIAFPARPVMTCRLARALRRWLDEYVEPSAASLLHSRVAKVMDLSAYACRFVYNSKGEKISEHAVANAIDIGEFVTAKGEKISVLDNWNSPDERGVFLHEIHAGACKMFGTTLGPEANPDHKNHFHLDMKERRHPLCDFTPEQLIARARKQAQEAAQSEPPAKAPAETAEPKSPPAAAAATQKSAKKPAAGPAR